MTPPNPGADGVATRNSLWLFCQVVDNFGDAGVSWRLARELAAQHGFEPTLIIDDAKTLARIEPRLARLLSGDSRVRTMLDGVWIGVASEWSQPSGGPLPSVIVSAFGCELPPWLRARLAGGPVRPLWIHLEYLSAEPWVESCHGLVSLKPLDAAREHFLYPGFTETTAGLLREANLSQRRHAFARAGGRSAFLSRLGVAAAPAARVISLFCYASAPVSEWLGVISKDSTQTVVVAAGGCADRPMQKLFGGLPAAGQSVRAGNLELVRLPMLSQDEYDHLLWSCDVNMVRGEDSWIRAHWAEAPFIWQAYPQSEAVHLRKLEAFLDRMRAVQSDSRLLVPAEVLMRVWNDQTKTPDLELAWRHFQGALKTVAPAYAAWTRSLEKQSDLASRLARYCRDRI